MHTALTTVSEEMYDIYPSTLILRVANKDHKWKCNVIKSLLMCARLNFRTGHACTFTRGLKQLCKPVWYSLVEFHALGNSFGLISEKNIIPLHDHAYTWLKSDLKTGALYTYTKI